MRRSVRHTPRCPFCGGCAVTDRERSHRPLTHAEARRRCRCTAPNAPFETLVGLALVVSLTLWAVWPLLVG